MTRVGAELPQPQTQSGLKAHSISTAIGPASVASRCAPRGSSSRRRKAGPPGESGATQEPHSTPAQDTEAVDRAPLLALPPTKPGPEARVHLLCPNGPITVALGDGLPPIRARLDDHVPIRARPGKLFPARPHAGRGGRRSRPCRPASRQRSPARPHAGRGVSGRHAPATRSRRVPARAARPLTARRGAREDQGRASPRHVVSAVPVEITVHGVKQNRPAGPVAARGPSTSRPTWPSGERPPITPGAP